MEFELGVSHGICLTSTMTTELKLFVYIIGLDGPPFPVHIPASEFVGDLKNTIFREMQHELKDASAFSISSGKDLADRPREFIEKSYRIGDVSLDPTLKLSSAFNDAHWKSISDGLLVVVTSHK
jgi:Crinkler effector protein N-terminal domain